MPTRKSAPQRKGAKEGGVAQLPHNLGPARQATLVASNLPSEQPKGADISSVGRQLRPRSGNNKVLHPVATPARSKARPKASAKLSATNGRLMFKVTKLPSLSAPKTRKSDGRTNKHDLTTINEETPKKPQADVLEQEEETGPATKRRRTERGSVSVATVDINKQHSSQQPEEERPRKSKKKIQDRTPYEKEMGGLAWKQTPYPERIQPTPEACEEVHKLLSDQLLALENTTYVQPEAVPPPSLEVAGCGEVPGILDALIRTLLSASTTEENAGAALRGLEARFGKITLAGPKLVDGEDDILIKDEIDYMKIHLADIADVEKAIYKGGLAKVKSQQIKGILSQVHSQNLQRVDAFRLEKLTGAQCDIPDTEELDQGNKDMEIWLWEQNVLSLNYYHGLSAEAAMNTFVRFSGIGVKTAACVILFNMRQPCFAVDTHVWRMCKWLGWAPLEGDRNKSFAHLDVRVPDHLKYPLHQLFYNHGRNCDKCKVGTTTPKSSWKGADCPLEHLVERTVKERKAPKRKSDAEENDDSKSSRKRKRLNALDEAESSIDAAEIIEEVIEDVDAAEAVLNPEAEGSTVVGVTLDDTPK